MGSTDRLMTTAHVALMSLPRLFRTDLHTVPRICPCYSRNQSFSSELQVINPPGGISVGLVWASNPDNKHMYRHKSCSLALLMHI